MYVREGIGILLLLLALLRASLLVMHEPVVGYAATPDMVRAAACHGLYPGANEKARVSVDATVPFYRRDAAAREGCYADSDMVFVAAVLAVARSARADDQGLAVKWIGLAKVGLLFATAFLLAWAFHHHPGAAIVNGVVVLLVLADPVVTLWFNTLYPEFFIVWGLYAAIGAACALALAERGAIAMWLLLGVGTLALAFSTEQYALLAPAVVAASWPWLWYRSKAATITVFAIATLACLVSFAFVKRPESAQLVNRVATHEPEALARYAAKSLPTLQPMAVAALGTKEGPRKFTIRELPWWAFSPLEAVGSRLPVFVFVPLALAGLLIAPLALLLAIAWARPSSATVGTPLLFGMLLGGTALYAFVTSAFGYRPGDAARHFLPGALAMYSALVALLAGVPFALMRWRGSLKQGAKELIVGLVVVAIIVVGAIMALQWGEAQPLAIGAIEEPGAKPVPAAALRVSGWALDPYGVESVHVHLGKLDKAARFGEARPDIESAYPGYPDAAASRFVLDLTAEELAAAGAPGELPLRIVVKNRRGATSELEQRQVTIQPPPA